MFYPIMIDMSNKKIVVVGGGKIGYRKSQKLLEFGGEVMVISPKFSKEFCLLEKEYADKIILIRDFYNKKYLKKAFLVIAATDSSETNQQIAIDSRNNKSLCNVVDNREKSSFISTSTINKEGLVVSISTMGKFPYLSKKVRKDLQKQYSKFDKEYVDVLEKVRKVVLKKYKEHSEKIFDHALDLNIEELKVFLRKLEEDLNGEVDI